MDALNAPFFIACTAILFVVLALLFELGKGWSTTKFLRTARLVLLLMVLVVSVTWCSRHQSALRKERQTEKDRIAAIDAKVEENLENYAKAEPLLRGETKASFERAARTKIYSLGYSPEWPGFKGKSYASMLKYAQQKAEEKEAAREARELAGQREINLEIEQCNIAFDVSKCQKMVSIYSCVAGTFCTQAAHDILTEYVSDEVDNDEAYCESVIENYVSENRWEICE